MKKKKRSRNVKGTKTVSKRKEKKSEPVTKERVPYKEKPYKEKPYKIKMKSKVEVQAKPLKYEVLFEKKVDFTHDLAYKILEMPCVENDRNVNVEWVQNFLDEMKTGTFRPEGVELATCLVEDEDRIYRVNGQHCCWARTELPEVFPPAMSPIRKLAVRWVQYKVKTMDDLKPLFMTFDSGNKRNRGMKDVVGLYSNFNNVMSKMLLKRLVAGYRQWRWESTRDRKRVDQNALHHEILNKNDKLFRVAGSIAQEVSGPTFMRRAAICAAILATSNKAVQPSMEFFDTISSGLGITKKTDARKTLREWLMTSSLSSGAGMTMKGNGTGKGLRPTRLVGTEDVYRVCLSAWNAWRQGKPYTVVRLPNSRPTVK